MPTGHFDPLPDAEGNLPVRNRKFIDVEIYGNLNAETGTLGDLVITGSITIGAGGSLEVGDIYSSNWDGAIPLDLSAGVDATATAGYALDSSEGSSQWKNIFIEGGKLGDLYIVSDILGDIALSSSVDPTDVGSGDTLTYGPQGIHAGYNGGIKYSLYSAQYGFKFIEDDGAYISLGAAGFASSMNFGHDFNAGFGDAAFISMDTQEEQPDRLMLKFWGFNEAPLFEGEAQVQGKIASYSNYSWNSAAWHTGVEYLGTYFGAYLDSGNGFIFEQTADTVELEINNTVEFTWSAAGFDLENNDILDVGNIVATSISAKSASDLDFKNGAGTTTAFWDHTADSWLYVKDVVLSSNTPLLSIMSEGQVNGFKFLGNYTDVADFGLNLRNKNDDNVMRWDTDGSIHAFEDVGTTDVDVEIFPYGTLLNTYYTSDTGTDPTTSMADMLTVTVTLDYSGQPVIVQALGFLRSSAIDENEWIAARTVIDSTNGGEARQGIGNITASSHSHGLHDHGGGSSTVPSDTVTINHSDTRASVNPHQRRVFTPAGSSFTVKLQGQKSGSPTTSYSNLMVWVWRG